MKIRYVVAAAVLLVLAFPTVYASLHKAPSSIYGTTVIDGVPFERYCGYIEKVGHGVVTFENDTEPPLHVAYLLFKTTEGQPLLSKVVYGDSERIEGIKSHRYYDIGRRMYGEGWNFPRRL